jgi:hypothetical protein
MTNTAIRTLLQDTAVDLGAPGYDTTFGWGRIDCGAAAVAASSSAGATSTPTPRPTPSPVPSQTSQAIFTVTATRTASPTATQPAGTIGGKGLAISQSSSGVRLTWQGGAGQSSYSLARLSGSALNVVTTFEPLPASSTSYVDTTATGPSCYVLFVLGTNPEGVSDLVCDLIGFHTPTGFPRDFTLQLNQSSAATLTWAPPTTGGQDGYLLVPLGGSGQTFTGDATYASAAASGLTCYLLGATGGGALLGYTDILCGLPGFTNLSAASAGAMR